MRRIGGTVDEAIIRATYRAKRARGMDLLSARVRPVCFVPVPRPSVSLGIRIACVAFAGTAGALAMLAQRRGGVVEMFATHGTSLASGGSPLAAAAVGLVIHVLWVVAWSLAFAAFVQRLRRPHAALAALVIATLAFVVSFLVAGAYGGPVAMLPIPERVLVHAVLAISLGIGMRLAPEGDGPEVQRVSTQRASTVAPDSD